MMEPVAWRLRWIYPATGQATSWAATTDKLVADQKERDGLEVEPLVPASRLSDAEARIAEARDKALEEAWQAIKAREAEYEASFEANEFKGMSLAAIAALASAAANVRALKEKP